MRTWTWRMVAVLASCLVVAGCGGDGGDPAARASGDGTGGTGGPAGSITVFAAASLTDAFTEVAEAFEAARPGTEVVLNIGASSSLREQILAGAPADVYASANPSNMDQVVEAGAATGPEVFTTNRLEIVVPAGNPAGITGLDDFAVDDLFLGLCAEEVPCGSSGREALDAAGVTPAIDTNATDVRALLTQVRSGDLDAGIVYRTDVIAAGDAVEGVAIPAGHNVESEYPIATLTEAAEPRVAEAFVDFVLSEGGRDVLQSHGFGAP